MKLLIVLMCIAFTVEVTSFTATEFTLADVMDDLAKQMESQIRGKRNFVKELLLADGIVRNYKPFSVVDLRKNKRFNRLYHNVRDSTQEVFNSVEKDHQKYLGDTVDNPVRSLSK